MINTNKFNRAYLKCNNPKEYNNLTDGDKQVLLTWIQERLAPYEIKSYNPNLSSYGLKHMFEREKDIYLTNGEYKGAMLSAGYVPKDENSVNWIFKIGKKVKFI